jgi:hypothetical protein
MTDPVRTASIARITGLACLLLVSCSNASPDANALPGLMPTRGTAHTAEWAAIAEGLDAPVGDRDATPCHRGEPACFEAVIAEMRARLDALGCDHRAPFAFTYLTMTEGVAEQTPTFEDPALLTLVDARFAQIYFDAVDNWAAGRNSDVPAAWQIAFASAENGQTSAAADLILGMNAHISRDLAYTVAAVLEPTGDLASESGDYRRINDVIGEVKDHVLRGASDRFDPNLFLLDQELDIDQAPDPVELITRWRSRSFELGSSLAQTETADDRAAVVADIERTSAAAASIIVAADTALRSGTLDEVGALASFRSLDPDQRDRYCAEQLGG